MGSCFQARFSALIIYQRVMQDINAEKGKRINFVDGIG